MAKRKQNRTKAKNVQTYCIKVINRRILNAENQLRELRAVKAVLAKSPGQAVVITTVYPQEGGVDQVESPDIKVEMASPFGSVTRQMRQTERQFSEVNGNSNFGKERAVMRVDTLGIFGQVEIPVRFWTPRQKMAVGS